MFALSPSELGIVAFLVAVVLVGVRLSAWGDALGSLIHRAKTGKKPTQD